MDSSSRDALLKLFDDLLDVDHLTVVRNYVAKLSLIKPCLLKLLNSAEFFIKDTDDDVEEWDDDLDDDVEEWDDDLDDDVEEWDDDLDDDVEEWDDGLEERDDDVEERDDDVEEWDDERASFITQNLEELFAVPNLIESDTLKKNEVLAAFLDFLLQLLYYEDNELCLNPIQEELRFLLMVLGDAPFIQFLREEQQHEEVYINLLAEFEAVANEAGSLVHSLILSDYEGYPDFEDDGIGVVLEHMDVLKGNINSQILNFSKQMPLVAKPHTTSKTSSLFIFGSLIYDLDNLLNRDDPRITGDVKDQIKEVHQELILSQSFLKGIKLPPPQSELEEHVVRITDVAFEVEYLINSFLAGDAPLSYFSIRLPHVLHNIKLITETQLQQVKNIYDFGALKLANSFSSQLQLQAKRHSEVDDTVVGFEGSKWVEDILDHLVGGTEQRQIISIYGMPGLGKTTFAKKLYNHPTVKYRFDKRSWCVVSQRYQRKSLLTDILISLDKDKSILKKEESLDECIYKSLKGRRYLIVMDDVWDSKPWDDLRRFFPDDGNGSRILFTTRHKDAAPPNSIFCELPQLSNDQCWELLAKKVFNNEAFPSQLLRIGKQIATNCHRLPLTVVVIAGILSNMDKEESAWKKVGDNISAYISRNGNNSTMQILELSYKHLPEYLKPCFLYFGSFSEDEKIPAHKLMRLWSAEGFIPKGDSKSPESLAEEYLIELIDRSLVMVAERRSSDDGIKACVIHDLLRELCFKISTDENFMKWVVDDKFSIHEKSHRLVNSQYVSKGQSIFGQHVRSFQWHGISDDLDSGIFVGNMKLLRVLDIMDGFIQGGRWIGVEYLVNLRHLVIDELPSMIGNLVNLEYLHVMGEDPKIPLVILKMDKLRYLCSNEKNPFVFDEDCNSSQTNNIEVLSWVHIRNQKDAEMFKCSPHLRELKCNCENFYGEEKGSYQYIDLLFLTHLESLTVSSLTFSEHERVLEINFPSKIKKLNLEGLKLPWEKMSIIGGLPNLQLLKLVENAFVGETWDTKDGEFQELTFLKLYSMDLKQWNVASSEHFPKLQRLVLWGCLDLEEIPCEIGEIGTLQSIKVECCAETVDESARKIEQEQQDMGNEELKVIINSWMTETSEEDDCD